MAVTFPTSPTNGQTFTANGLSYVYNATYGVWRLNVSAGGSSGGGGVTTYATVAELPLTNNTNGDMAFVEETDRLYLSNDNGWFNIALINTSPTITQGGTGSYVLATDGTPTVITLTATDPEEVPLTWSYTVTSGALGTTATVSQADNVFTITPGTTDPDDAGTFEITFSVTDGTNIVNDVNSFSLEFITIVENSKYTTALITTDGSTGTNTTFTDSSTNSLTLTPVDSPSSQSFSPYRSGGYSTYHPGTTDDGFKFTSVTAPGSGNFTYECWIYATGAADDPIIETRDVNNVAGGFTLTALTTSSIRIWDTQARVTATGLDYINKWTHIAVVKNSSTTTLYINGVSQGTTTAFGTHSDDDLYVGYSPHYSQGFTGYISDLRYTTTAVYTSDFTPPTERLTAIVGTQVLTSQLPYIADGSSNNYTITVNGNTSTKPFSPYDYLSYDSATHSGSIYFSTSGSTATSNGTGQYVQSALSSGLTLDTNDFTISCWVYGISKLRNYPRILQIGPQNSTWALSQLAILYKHNDDNDSICLAMHGIGGNAMLIASGPISDNQWYHVAVTRSGSTFTMYINGESVGTYTSTGSATGTGDKALIIGSSTSGDADFHGYIADVRVINGTVVYTGNFTPPTEPTSSTGTEIHVIGNDANIIDKSQTTTLTLSGDTTASTTQTKYASSSIYLDGTGDYLDIIEDDGFNFGTGDFTIEFWMWPAAIGTENIILESRATHTDTGFLVMLNGGVIKTITGGAIITTGTTTPTINSWYHVAVVRDSTSMRVYINGTEESGSAAGNTSNVTNPFGKFRVGTRFDVFNSFNGYIEDLRITKGLARYTANFTPPTASLDG